MSKAKAYTFQHTHWDQEWYFTKQENEVEFVYHMKELLYALDHNLFQYYHLDGKTSHLETYFRFCPEDKEKFIQYVKAGRVIIGPSYDQESCFIQTGEQLIKNLEVGIEQADEYGGSSKVAYLPDSFGQTQDFPKVFNGFGIKDFIFRRGMSNDMGLKNEFLWQSNDGSEVLVSVLQAGYSFAGLAFFEGRLISNAGLNLDKKDIISQMKFLSHSGARDGVFLFPAGKDNVPVMLNFKELIDKYNRESEDFEFIECSYEDYMKNLRSEVKDFQVYKGEFYDTEQHRVHHSIFSARPDIKIVQDHCARLLSLVVEPEMVMLDKLGIKYERGLVNEAWKLLLLSQTHSEATNSDETNEQILARAKYADFYAQAIKIYLTRKVAQSCRTEKEGKRVTVFNTLPTERDLTVHMTVYTKKKEFTVWRGLEEIPYTLVRSEQIYGGWKRKNPELLDPGRDYYESDIIVSLDHFKGLSYETLVLDDSRRSSSMEAASRNKTYIENDKIRLEIYNGKISLRLKEENRFIEDAVYFDDCGDAGDTFDYDVPDHDSYKRSDFRDSTITECYESTNSSMIQLEGSMSVPADLREREFGEETGTVQYKLRFEVTKGSPILNIKGSVVNNAKNHKFRLVVATGISTVNSIAGTQFGDIERANHPSGLDRWVQEKWLERPDPIYPMLNFAALADKDHSAVIYTRSTKEYEAIGDTFDRMAVTIYRSIGHFGLPDLNRRPGRASGIPEQIMECPLSQMMGKEISFDYGVSFGGSYDVQKAMKQYVEFAAEDVYFENQEFNRVFTPMKYFEINDAVVSIPNADQLMELEDSELIFSTLTKSKKDNAYLLRLFNAANKEVNGGTLKVKFPFSKIEYVDFMENKINECSPELGKIGTGKILTIKIYAE